MNAPPLIVTPAAAVSRPALTVTPALNVCSPVHVGTIACDNAGAPSERIAVVATPAIVAKPIVAVGVANPVTPPPDPDACKVLVLGLNVHTMPPPSANIKQRAVARKFPVSLTEDITTRNKCQRSKSRRQ